MILMTILVVMGLGEIEENKKGLQGKREERS
jgi:hypothetical protein